MNLLVIVANAKWAWDNNKRAAFQNNFAHYIQYYEPLLDPYDRLLFTADGDPIEKKYQLTPNATMFCPSQYHSALVGYLIDSTAYQQYLQDPATSPLKLDPSQSMFVGSRFGKVITQPGRLLLSMNDLPTPQGYQNNSGWCEIWIAVYRPVNLN